MDDRFEPRENSGALYGSPEPPPAFDQDNRPFIKREVSGIFSRLGWGLVLLMVLGSGLQYALIIWLMLSPGGMPDWFSSNYIFFMTLPIYVVGVPAIFLLLRKMPVDETISRRRLSKRGFFAALAVSFTAMIAGNIISMLLMNLIGLVTQNELTNPLESMISDSSLAVTFFTVCICAPVMEELVFRKILLDRISIYGDKLAIVISGVMFGLFHGNFYQFFYATFLGMVFAWVYLRSGKVILPIIIHGCINFFGSVFAPYLLEKTGSLSEDIFEAGMDALSAIDPETLGAVALLGLYSIAVYGLAITGLVLLISKRKKLLLAPPQYAIPKGKRFSATIGNPGMIAFLVLMLLVFAMSIFS